MRTWYKYETGNENYRDALCRHLRRLGVRYEVHDDSKRMRCDWWRIAILIADPKQVTEIEHWLNTH